jgi:GTPase involved in cell partitioning and DNA repair
MKLEIEIPDEVVKELVSEDVNEELLENIIKASFFTSLIDIKSDDCPNLGNWITKELLNYASNVMSELSNIVNNKVDKEKD